MDFLAYCLAPHSKIFHSYGEMNEPKFLCDMSYVGLANAENKTQNTMMFSSQQTQCTYCLSAMFCVLSFFRPVQEYFTHAGKLPRRVEGCKI